jgi:hypothetical protein
MDESLRRAYVPRKRSGNETVMSVMLDILVIKCVLNHSILQLAY